jgi:hypothetical protein
MLSAGVQGEGGQRYDENVHFVKAWAQAIWIRY